MKLLGIGYQKIGICLNFCILYYLENAKLTECKTYKHTRYKLGTDRGMTLVSYRKLRYFSITPRLQRLLMSPKTVEHMAWHHSHDAVNRVMVHPSDGESKKYYNMVHP